MTTKGRGYFGGEEFSFDIPAGWNLLAMAEPKDVPGLANVGAEVHALLEHPIGMAPLAQVVQEHPGARTVIVTEDQERPAPVSLVLVPLLNELNALGISDEKIDVVIGVGTHRAPDRAEIRAKLGTETLSRVRVSVHDADAADLPCVGTTTRGTRVCVNRLVADAGLVFGIGTINAHYIAGYGGGPKLILPGVSSRETIKQNHVWMRGPTSATGILDGNPVWEDMLESARLAGLTFKFDALLNARKEICRLYGGEVEAQQKAAVEGLKEINGVRIPAPADITITSAHPLDMNLIQSGKAVLLAEGITKPGGTIVLVSSCPGGAGPLMYETLSERPSPGQVIDWIAEGKATPTAGPMASRLRALVQSKRLVVVTNGLQPQQLADMEFGYAPSLEQALADLSRGNGRKDVIVLPVGGNTVPYLV